MLSPVMEMLLAVTATPAALFLWLFLASLDLQTAAANL
jgi:hypothetical protein